MEANNQKNNIDTSVIENLITGRVYPHIYAFSTKTVPKYWKIGDTVRPVGIRLTEWRKHYHDLTQEYSRAAKVGDKFFRDYAIHSYLERELGKKRLQRQDLPANLYYSNEFFKDVNTENLEDAFNHIEQDAVLGGGIYQLYDERHLSEPSIYVRDTVPYKLRPNQDDAVKAFVTALKKGRTKLLMYAVMRFGKSFTSMCCANAMDAKIVVIVSGKADVKEEWKKTVEKIANFEGFVFLNGELLLSDENIIKSNIESGKKAAIFLTLQDLQGDEIKKKHKEVFDSQIDLLIVDETHYGARATEYGKVLQNAGLTKNQIENELKQKDIESVEDIDIEVQKHLKAKITLHLSGTPYRILMSSEFSEDDIISFCQFTDIIDASDKWIEENNQKEEPEDEWENPYYGFPQMIRFAFTPNESSLKKIKQLKESGKTAALSALLKPQSIDKDTAGNYKKFENESEVCDLLRAIDGSREDKNIFSFLNHDKIKQGEMCHHIVFVLPYRASCDAMQELITNNPDKFDNLSQYEIINIAGVNSNTLYPSIESIKSKIKRCESEGKKTITLTVNRMLTGNTVEEWDTMIFLKDTASPQEYDQAIFRLQNQYVVTYEDAEGKTIKYNKKPQTLLVDFDVDRMFRLQELKSQFYNANTDANGNEKLEVRLSRELEISPIICLNKDKLHQVSSANIMDAVREYSQSRSVMDEATDIPVDENILTDDEIISIIKDLIPIDSKKGITFKPTEGDDDIDTIGENNTDTEGKNGTGAVGRDQLTGQEGSQGGERTESSVDKDNAKELAKKLQTYYLQILFFAFLTESNVRNLGEVISVIDATDDNKRIARNLGLDKDELDTLHSKCTHFIHSKLDYKIENINNLICDETMEPVKRVDVALTQFGRISDSEIVTPKNIAADMIALLPEIENLSKVKFLDIASKQGEFAYAIYKRFVKVDDVVKNNIYSLPTSPLCYEFTRKIYKLLGMPVENIIKDFTTFDLIKENNKERIKHLKDMKFDVIVGNPPYQSPISTSESNKSLSKQLFPEFIKQSLSLSTTYTCLITPMRWFTGDAQDKSFVSLRNEIKANNGISNICLYHNVDKVFSNVVIKGGICIILNRRGYKGNVEFVIKDDNGDIIQNRPLFEKGMNIIISDDRDYKILQKINSSSQLTEITTGRNPFGIIGKEDVVNAISSPNKTKNSCILRCKNNVIRYVKRDKIVKNEELLQKFKVIISKSAGDPATDKNIIGTPYIGVPNDACTDSFITIGSFDTKEEAINLQKYIKTLFLRYLVSILKTSQNVTQIVYKFVPMQDFTSTSDIDWSKSVPEIDQQLYAKYGLNESEIAFIESKIKPME
ncbi:MAG: Eco57I restriction-modification methylase domain-containing protein [Bacteroidaceae bacterium]|nr:Eco57I restriction-modification methylase domain-containing protein [Bacteroidaceae bacterium]